MTDELKQLFAKIRNTGSYADIDYSDVNACTNDGDNALHCVILWGDIPAARMLITAGIDVNKAGDLGYTPLHIACMKGNAEMVRLLIENGASLFALSEGETPFSSARREGHDYICELLRPLMEKAQSQDPKVWVRARIAQLRRELSDLEKKLSG
jgi:ankyrin repeat protein